MARIAFNIKGAAKTASVTEEIIIEAVKRHELIARRIGGKRAVILGVDILAWLLTYPDYLGG
jgi:hypothetical protein